jgi:multidrug efflux pump subunit AcrB
VLKNRFATLLVFLATLALSVYLFAIIPKGFFPQHDTGLITGVSEAAHDVSFSAMTQYQQSLGDIVLKDPAVDHVAMSIGGTGNALNTGWMFITLKPRDQRDVTADQVIARLRKPLAQMQGASLFLQSAQDVRVGGRASRTQFRR